MSIYSVGLINILKNDEDSSEISIYPGMNYFIKMVSNSTTVKIMNSNQMNINKENLYYINFHSDNCTIKVNASLHDEKYIAKNNKTKFYYNFLNLSNPNISNEYIIEKSENNDYCLVEISLFEYKRSNNELNSIYLFKDKNQNFIFNTENNQVKFRYLFVDDDKELEFNIIPNNVSNLEVEIVDLKVNGDDAKKDKDKKLTLKNNTNNTIQVEAKKVKEKCKNNNDQPCNIEITLKATNPSTDSLIEINIEHSKEESESSGEKSKLGIIFGILGGCVFIVVVIIIVICVCRNKGDHDRLSKEVNTISYVQDRDNDKDDDKDDDDEDDGKRDTLV